VVPAEKQEEHAKTAAAVFESYAPVKSYDVKVKGKTTGSVTFYLGTEFSDDSE